MSDASAESQKTNGEEDAEWDSVEKKFDNQISVGDTFYLYQSWSAWAVRPVEKTIAPILRIAVGDLNGNLVFDRSVVLTGVADLMNEFAGTFLNEVTKARDMPAGFKFELPIEPSSMLDDLRSIRDRISASLDILEKSDAFTGLVDSSSERKSSS